MKNIESIWVSGIPENINPDDIMQEQDLLDFALKFTIENLVKGCKVEGINNDLKKFPHLIINKGNIRYGIVVVPCVYPNFFEDNKEFRLEFVKNSTLFGMVPVICPIIIRSTDEARANASITLKRDSFNLINPGMKILTPEENQDLSYESMDFKF